MRSSDNITNITDNITNCTAEQESLIMTTEDFEVVQDDIIVPMSKLIFYYNHRLYIFIVIKKLFSSRC